MLPESELIWVASFHRPAVSLALADLSLELDGITNRRKRNLKLLSYNSFATFGEEGLKKSRSGNTSFIDDWLAKGDIGINGDLF